MLPFTSEIVFKNLICILYLLLCLKQNDLISISPEVANCNFSFTETRKLYDSNILKTISTEWNYLTESLCCTLHLGTRRYAVAICYRATPLRGYEATVLRATVLRRYVTALDVALRLRCNWMWFTLSCFMRTAVYCNFVSLCLEQ